MRDNKTVADVATGADEEVDFSSMSLDDLLESVRRDIEPKKEPDEIAVVDEPDAYASFVQVSAPRSKRWDEPAESAYVVPVKRRRFGFYKILIVIVVVLLAGICAGAVYFWRYIDAYEKSLPEHVIEALRDNIDLDFWEKSVEDAIAPLLTEFEQGDDYSPDRFIGKIRDVQYTIRQKSDESTDEMLVYIVRAGAQDIGIVRLVPSESAGYGFTMWKVGEIELIDSFVEALPRSVSITASQNAAVEINGVAVSREYEVDCEFRYGVSYRVQGLFGDVDVTVVEFNGRKPTPYYDENDEYYYTIIEPFDREFNFIVPEDALVFIDDVRVPSEFIVDDLIVPGIFDGILEPADVPVKFVRYDIKLNELYVEPVLAVTDALGDVIKAGLTDGGDVIYDTGFSEELEENFSATVEAFVRAYVRFGANLGNSAEGNFATLSGYMLRDSDLYRRTRASIEGMIWVSGTSVEYNSLDIVNFRQYGDEYFSCEVHYNITNKTYYEAREVEGDYEVLFVLSGGKWLVVKMDAL
ncbi:MAG: hypothetical protein FWH33_04455 [Oscillospiraceae bacterium]|nr:hypothetical protein [Oscillospiraceae bacterium]